MRDPMADASEGLVLRRIRESFPGVTVVDCDGFAFALEDWKDGVTCLVYNTQAPDLDLRGAFTISGLPVVGPPRESVARLSPLLWSFSAIPGAASLVLRNGGTILISKDHVIGLQPGRVAEIIHTRAGLLCHDSTTRREP